MHANQTKSGKYSRHDWQKILRFVGSHAASKNVTQVAASLTFTTVLGMVPLLAVVLSLFTAFPLFAEFRVELEEFLTANLMPPAVSANIMDYLNEFAAKASGLTAIGSLALFITSIMLLRTIDEAFNNIWHVEQQRPMRQRILVYWAIISLGPLLAGASLWASTMVARYSATYVESLPFGLSIFLTITPLIVTILGFAGLFILVPNCRVRWKDALAGGIITAIALSIMRHAFALYISKFPSYAIIYGAFATLPIFLLWIYLSWATILSGASIAATLPSIRQRQWDHDALTGSLFVNAITILRILWSPKSTNMPGYSLSELMHHSALNQTEIIEVLSRLAIIGFVAKSESSKKEVWLLACDPRYAKLEPLVNALLIDKNQPYVQKYPVILEAIALVLMEKDIYLQTLLEEPRALS